MTDVLNGYIDRIEQLGGRFVPRAAPYAARPIRRRRTRSDIDAIRSAITEALYADAPMTVRQVFYRLVSIGAIAKSEAEYKQTVCRLLGEMRLDGTIPYGSIADSTRWMRKPQTWNSVEDALRETARLYRRNVWWGLGQYVEVWIEKEALAGVLSDVTSEYAVPLMVTRGYPSLTYLHAAAEAIVAQIRQGRAPTIYYLGDFDPSGVDIRRNVEQRLREFVSEINFSNSFGAFFSSDFTFQALAVFEEQIEAYRLQTRPTKQSDSRSRGFGNQSVELDAIAPNELRALVREAVESHLPDGALDEVHLAEESERAILTRIAETTAGTAA